MAKRRTPPRGPGGKFRRRAGARRKTRTRRNPSTNLVPRAAAVNAPRRRAQRNAPFRGFKFGKLVFPAFPRLAAGMGGMMATRLIPGYVSRFLPMMTNPWIGTAIQASVAVLGGSVVGQMTNRQLGEDFALCGLAMMADDVAQTWLYPQMGLGAYVGDAGGVGAYLDQYLQPGAIPGGPGGEPMGITDYGSDGVPSRLSSTQRL